ncbi:hypothetical protein Csp2054_14640 [Curtobacterium sp. 'Ferrero']|nr:hypothetical protein Csp2054_14640 [Curtobacterium sp. 'Ferrero']
MVIGSPPHRHPGPFDQTTTRSAVHDHDTHPLDRHVGPPHIERFRLTRTPGETLGVVCTCAIGADHDNTIHPSHPAPAR